MLREEFRAWMKRQLKPDGEPYSEATIRNYASALTSALPRDERGLQVPPNLDRAYSNAMELYRRFLNERAEPSAWVFQANPQYSDTVAAVESLDTISWTIPQYAEHIQAGDRAYIWLSGPNGGVIAVGEVTSDPRPMPPGTTDTHQRGTPSPTDPRLAVDIVVRQRLTDRMVRRAVLLADERTKRLEILTVPGATVFRVTTAQREVIDSIIDGTYQRVPASDDATDGTPRQRRYWLYSPGEQARLWDELYAAGLMAIGWDSLGDLNRFDSKAAIKSALSDDGSPLFAVNAVHALWQFCHEMSVGDVVFVKKGTRLILGRGVVASDYRFDATRSEYQHVRSVTWDHCGQWEHPGRAVLKTLTDITPNTQYVRQLEELVLDDEDDGAPPAPEDFPEYPDSQFLNEVYLDEQRFATLKALVLRKKNVILQGAPGVGKTYAAQRLAFAIMGAKDVSRVTMIQFHQSYSYEDFMMGYRPDGTGFRLAEGPFYEFCKRAEEDDERPYFFIIDEINRANLSKVFGELLMLIETDKRGERNAVRLLYKDEQFWVPPNVHLIGLMNTADRSLALIDYALRRRFAFFDLEPAFASDGFQNRKAAIQNPRFDALVSEVEALNNAIAADPGLGLGFRIGHSYFCTTEVADDAWLSAVVEYELLPLLAEYWFDEPAAVEAWTLRLRGAIRG
jgi:hypothetical protein